MVIYFPLCGYKNDFTKTDIWHIYLMHLHYVFFTSLLAEPQSCYSISESRAALMLLIKTEGGERAFNYSWGSKGTKTSFLTGFQCLLVSPCICFCVCQGENCYCFPLYNIICSFCPSPQAVSAAGLHLANYIQQQRSVEQYQSHEGTVGGQRFYNGRKRCLLGSSWVSSLCYPYKQGK